MKVLEAYPHELLTCAPTEAHQFAEELSLYHLKGERQDPLFISTLLHGNETSGFYALGELLKDYEGRTLPRDLIILLGNTQAAKEGLRHLSNQPDYNRIWKGGEGEAPKRALEILEYLKGQKLMATVDVHNSSGRNPPYVAVNKLDAPTLALGLSLSSKMVYFREPQSALAPVMSNLCPSVTFESGLSSDFTISHRIKDFIQELLHRPSAPEYPEDLEYVRVYHSFARIVIPEDVSFVFGNGNTDLRIDPELDRYNLHEVERGTIIAFCSRENALAVYDEKNNNVVDRFFEYRGGKIFTKESFVPSLLTVDPKVVRQDILGYIMHVERVSPQGG